MRPSRLPSRLTSRAVVRPLLILVGSLLFLDSRGTANEPTVATESAHFQAGAYAQNIDPETLPVWVNGGFVGKQIDRIHDSLHARCLVLSDGSEKVAICVVDSCVLPPELMDEAKRLAHEQTKIPVENILISATHTHSAPAAYPAHGTPVQEDYAAALPAKIALGIAKANERLEPAQVGFTSATAERYIHCRRWLMKPGTAWTEQFTGRSENQAAMNPGHDNPNKLRPTAEVDPEIPILSVQTADGKPLAVLASFNTHYAGSPPLSADYFGVVCRELASKLRPDDPSAFVGLMANGTSGDANCIDFSKPAQPFTHHDVGHYVAGLILERLPKVQYQTTAPIDVATATLTVDARMPSSEELEAAKAYVDTRLRDRLPQNVEETYARDTVLLSTMPKTRTLPLQGIRVGSLAIAANPCEAYNAIGSAVKEQSPFAMTMNIGLANGFNGYLPTEDQFALGGYTTWRARTSCLEESAGAKVVETLTGLLKQLDAESAEQASAEKTSAEQASAEQTTAGSGSQKAQAVPPGPLSPEESLKWFEVSEGQTLELIAAEPQAIDPVAIAFDDRGDLWVVEMSDYPTGPPNPGDPPLSRIRILRDQDLDGRYETAKTFADKLSFANGLQLWEDGAIVTAGGQLLLLRDTNGDGVADEREVWFDGLADQNPQLRANHPTIALNNYLYIANGLRTAAAIDRTGGVTGKEAETLNLSGRDMRIDLRPGISAEQTSTAGSPLKAGLKAEAVTGPSQFGLTWDLAGRRYFCTNRNPCVEVVIEQRDAALSPLTGIAPVTRDVVPAGEASQVHPLVQAWTTSNLHAGQFTAACGVLVTATAQLPPAPLGHALTCEPTGHLVHRRSIKREDARTQVADEPLDREWLASYDNWFRPVNLTEGPDGAVYIVDMYRAVIEHPDFVPQELKNRPDARYGDDRGRIYRSGLQNRAASAKIFQDLRDKPLRDRSTSELVGLLEHSNEWMRATAARLLLNRKSPAAIADLKELASGDNPFATRLRAAYMLLFWNALEPSVVQSFLAADDARLRTAAWELIRDDSQSADKFRAQAVAAMASSDLDEALAASWFLARTTANGDASQAVEKSVQLATRHANDPYVLMAATAACRESLDVWYEQWLVGLSGDSQDLTAGLASPVGDATWDAAERLAKRTAGQPSEASSRIRENLLRFATKAAAGEATDATRQRLWLSVAIGWADGGKRGSLADAKPLWDWVSALASETEAPKENRLTALRLLGHAPPELVKTLFPALPEELEDSVLAGAAITAWSRHTDDRRAPWMIERFTTATPRERTAIFDAVMARADSLTALVEALEAGTLKVRDFDATQIQRLGSSRNAELKPRITKVLQGAVDPNRAAVLKKYAASLEIDADPRQGAALFVKHCAACHQIDGVGHHVGPDISDSRTQQPLQLLTAVLDPNQAIDNRYFRYLALTEDGRVVDGVLAEETSETITLMRQNAERVVIERDAILELKPAGVSLMPEGLEAQMTPQEMANLVSYIKNWRYLKDNPEGIGLSGK